MPLKLWFVLTFTLPVLAGAATYEGKGEFEGREVRIYAELNIPAYLTSEPVSVKSSEQLEDPYHSDTITYHCTTSLEFQGATLFLQVSDEKTGQQLMFIDEEAASLKASVDQSFAEKTECKEVDFSKTKAALTFSPNATYHLPIAQKGGHDVSLALYPILNAKADLTLDKQGDRYHLVTEQFESRLPEEISIPVIHWAAFSQTLGNIRLQSLHR